LRYLFEDHVIDTDLRELHRGPEIVSVAPQVFDLLEYLIRNRDRVVSKDDLVRAVWKGRIVSDAALTTRLNAVRCAIGDTGEKQHLIKTLPRKGFRFVGSVQETQTPAIASVAAHPGEQDPGRVAGPEQSCAVNGEGLGAKVHDGGTITGPRRSPRLSVVVLPFVNLSGDPEHDNFVDGLVESLITDLSRISNMFARNSTLSYKGKEIDVRQVGRELNVRYVLVGSVQRNGNRLRMNVQLIDAESGKHLWAERFEKPIADLFDMQDEIVSRLAYTLHVQLVIAAARRAERLVHPDAKDLNF